MQINVEEEKNVPGSKLDNGETPNNQGLSESVIESSLAAVSTPSREKYNPDKGGSPGIDLNQPPIPNLDGHEKSETQSSQNDSNSDNFGNLITGLHKGVTTRRHSTTTEHAETSLINLIGEHYNGLRAYQRCWARFPNLQKRRRSENGPMANTTTSSLSPTKDGQLGTYPLEDARAHLYASSSKCLTSGEYNAVKDPVMFEAADRATHDASQAFEGVFIFDSDKAN